eukprot:5840294-Prymnesium_polylepis.1
MGDLSFDFHGFWLESSGAKSRTWTHVLSHRGGSRRVGMRAGDVNLCVHSTPARQIDNLRLLGGYS